MGIHTDIEWCDSSLNLAMGCQGCELWKPKAGIRRCYAGNLTVRYAEKNGWPVAFDQPRIFPERLKQALGWPDLTGKDRPDKPWLNCYPRLVFVNDMGDTFTENLPLMWMAPFVEGMIDSPHVYIILTKRPGRMVQFWRGWCAGEDAPIPPNFWLLTSVTSQENVGRVLELLKLRALWAPVLGVSYEPAWGPLDLTHVAGAVGTKDLLAGVYDDGEPSGDYIDWMICGGESGAGARPSHPYWFRSMWSACHAAGVPFFFKQWGEWAPDPPADGRACLVMPNGSWERFPVSDTSDLTKPDARSLYRIGKMRAGALLDGHEWREMPAYA